jgi:Fic family protein
MRLFGLTYEPRQRHEKAGFTKDARVRTPPAHRAGAYVMQPAGYRAFIPKPMPPNPPVALGQAMVALLSDADRDLARLDAATEFLPNPHMFVDMYVRKEAVLSSQIEGTQASMADLLEHEIRPDRDDRRDVGEVANYVRALNLGIERLATLPISLRLMREIHEALLTGVRGGRHTPGHFRRTQNWIGPSGCTLADASFVPPPPAEAVKAMGDLERFLHDTTPMPALVKVGLMHVQFETIHPFLDGNGRVGRLLITFLLCAQGILHQPTLYLSHYFKQHRQDYYDALQRVHDHGDFEAWIRFFLTGVRDVSREATDTARRVRALREEHRQLVTSKLRNSTAGFQLLDRLYQKPLVSVSEVADIIGRTYPVANELVLAFQTLRLLREKTGRLRNRVFAYHPYLDIFGELKP